MPRIAVGGFHHETNSFAPSRASYVDFERADAWPGLVRGAELAPALAGQNIGMSGFLAAAEVPGWEIAPLLWANAGPSGPVMADAYERIVGELTDRLAGTGDVDAIYLCLHGAMIAEHLEDGEGELLSRLRAVVGADVPIVASLDFHANVTARMVAASDGLVAYRTYPHLDMAETGARVQGFLARVLESGRRPAKAFRKLPYLVPISAQCTLAEPAASLYDQLRMAEHPALWGLSLTMGFPPADIVECGPAVLVYADTATDAENALSAIYRSALSAEERFAAPLLTPEDAVQAARNMQQGRGPVVLADTQDNPGAGGTSDTTFLLRELVRQKAEDALLGVVCDPSAARAAHEAGRGAEVALSLGGRSGVGGDTPYDVTVRVDGLSDGRFTGTGPFFGGSRFDLGPMALLRVLDGGSKSGGGEDGDGVRVVVSSVPQQAADGAMFRHLGADPTTAAILAVKSSVHFRADFGPIARDIIVVRAPGANIDDPSALPYTRLRSELRRRPGVG